MKAPWRKLGDSNPRYGKPVRQFSKLVVSATHPNFLSLLSGCVISQTRCKGTAIFQTNKGTPRFFCKKVIFGAIFAFGGGFRGETEAVCDKKAKPSEGFGGEAGRRVSPLSGWVDGEGRGDYSSFRWRTMPLCASLMKSRMRWISSLMGICSGILMVASCRLKLPV